MPRGDLDAPAVHADVVGAASAFVPELADRRAVDRHAPVEHELLGRAPRGDAGLREDLLKTFHGI